MNRLLGRTGAAGALLLTVALAAPSYAGTYKHHDPGHDMARFSAVSHGSGGGVQHGPSHAGHHADGDITSTTVDYSAHRVLVSVRMRAFTPSVLPRRLVQQSGGSSGSASSSGRQGLPSSYGLGALDEGLRMAARAFRLSTREVVFGVEGSNRNSDLVFAGRLPSGHMKKADFSGACQGSHIRFNPATTGVRLVIPARCLNGSPRVRVSVTSLDETLVATRHRFSDVVYVDSAMRRHIHPRKLLTSFTPWVHRG